MNLSFLSFLLFELIFILTTIEAAADIENNHVNGIIGAIVDNTSRIGKEQIVAMEMAVEDFNGDRNHSLVLQVRTSMREPLQAALAGKHIYTYIYISKSMVLILYALYCFH